MLIFQNDVNTAFNQLTWQSLIFRTIPNKSTNIFDATGKNMIRSFLRVKLSLIIIEGLIRSR